jgi:hypothetical protein
MAADLFRARFLVQALRITSSQQGLQSSVGVKAT